VLGIGSVVAVLVAAAAPSPSIEVGGHPGEIALVRGRPWVTVYGRRDRGRVVRIDTATNRVTARVRLRGSPFEIAAGAGGVWVTGNFSRGQDVLHRIDPGAGRVVATIALPGRYAGALAVGTGSVWVVVLDRRGSAYSLARVDPSTNRVAETWPVVAARGRYVTRIAVGRGAVWLLALRLGRRWEKPGDVIRFDPGAGRAVATIDAAALTMGLGPGGLWVTGCTVCGAHRTSYFARRIDTGSNQLVGTRIVKPGIAFGPLFVGKVRVWFGGYDKAGRPIAFRVDPRTGRTDRLVGLGSVIYSSMAFDRRAHRLWVARAPGGVLRVDLAGR
jgi:DNA-binding beta-propeller fold protein YncE